MRGFVDAVLVVSERELGGKQTSFYDLFRVENDKLAEHWDTMQTVSDKKDWRTATASSKSDHIAECRERHRLPSLSDGWREGKWASRRRAMSPMCSYASSTPRNPNWAL